MTIDGMAHSVRCMGVTIRTYANPEEAKELLEAIIEEPGLFIDVDKWDPGNLYQYVNFADDSVEED